MSNNTILVLGGYGGNNVGDDAQLEGALQDINHTLPEASIIVLTPNLDQTMSRHLPDSVSYAPRISFFDFDENPQRYIQSWKSENKKWIFNRSDFILNEVIKYKSNLSHKLSAKQIQAVNLIKNTSMVYYAGGGFLMGPTGSRLWDGALVCQIAKTFNTPVVMSGQNIGVWLNDDNSKLAANSFDEVKIIGTRDNTFSKSELKKVGIEGEHIFSTHDDALYINNGDDKTRDYILSRVGLDKEEEYISLSFHLEDGIEDFISVIRKKTDMPILIIPTCPPDKKPQKNIYNKLVNSGTKNIHIVQHLHTHSKIKAIISNAAICISTRHHPVIFALSGNVPSISLNYTEYFSQKNYGALKLCNVGEFSLDVLNKNKLGLDVFESLLGQLLSNRDVISKNISESHISIKESKEKFLKLLRAEWDRNS